MQEHAVRLVKEAMDIAGVTPVDISCIAYTKVLSTITPVLGSVFLARLSCHCSAHHVWVSDAPCYTRETNVIEIRPLCCCLLAPHIGRLLW